MSEEDVQRDLGKIEGQVESLQREIDDYKHETMLWRKTVMDKMDEFHDGIHMLRGEIRSKQHEDALERAHRMAEIQAQIEKLHPLRKKDSQGVELIDKLKLYVYAAGIVGIAIAAYLEATKALISGVLP